MCTPQSEQWLEACKAGIQNLNPMEPGNLKIFLSIAVSRDWPIKQSQFTWLINHAAVIDTHPLLPFPTSPTPFPATWGPDDPAVW